MYQIVVLIHILSAVVWVGGLTFLALVAAPATRSLPAVERGALLNALGQRFRAVGWVCIGLLVATGIVISGYRGITWQAVAGGDLFASTFGSLLGLKVGVVALMIAISLVHDLWLGPASSRALTHGEVAGPVRARLRRASAWTARLSLLLALVIVFLAVSLVRGLP